ncbi:putative electron transport protein YkgF [Escherichia coli]|nr:putative electron transport YkgF domain protein [Shigella flexneri 2850-71]SPW73125.1 putative electron transport protein YkgF [Escherichia coli]
MSIKTSNTDFKTRIRQQIEDPIMRKAVAKRAAAYWGKSAKNGR